MNPATIAKQADYYQGISEVIEAIEKSTQPKVIKWRTEKPAWKDQFYNGQWDSQLKDEDIQDKKLEIINSICGVPKPKGKSPRIRPPTVQKKATSPAKEKASPEKKKKKILRKRRVTQVLFLLF